MRVQPNCGFYRSFCHFNTLYKRMETFLNLQQSLTNLKNIYNIDHTQQKSTTYKKLLQISTIYSQIDHIFIYSYLKISIICNFFLIFFYILQFYLNLNLHAPK